MNHTPAQLRKRKFYLVLPLLALPFITMAFWAMGGGKERNEDVKTTGLNMELPDAMLKDEKNFDKMSFYNQSEKDSIKNAEAIRNDPGYKPDTGINVLELIHKRDNELITSPYGNKGIDANEQKVYRKINELNQQINNPVTQTRKGSLRPPDRTTEPFSKDIDKLQSMMEVMNDKPEGDPEMEKIGSVLDKILDIQHPERVKDKVKDRSVKSKIQVFPVQGNFRNDNISLLSDTVIKKKVHNHFYDLADKVSNNIADDPAIEAVVHQAQTVASGSAVKFRLINDIYVNGLFIPKGNFIYGTASLENERVSVSINAIRYQNHLLPVSLTVYDLDGIAGIHMPGAISRDVAKQSVEQGLQHLDITTLDPSLAAQAANTGIQAAKSLLTKKVKQVKVTLKAGYKVLLSNKQN